MFFLIGSNAVKTILNDFHRDITKSDLDIFCSKADFNYLLTSQKESLLRCYPLKKNKYRIKIKDYPIIELKVYDNNSIYHWLSLNQSLLSKEKYLLNNVELHIPNINCLTLIKKSHLYWPIHWLKNIEDYHWLKKHNTSLNDKEIEFFKKIKSEMKLVHGKIPSGIINDNNIINWKNELDKLNTKFNDNESNTKLIYFIHEKLSIKNKLKVINNWDFYINLFKMFENKDVLKMKY